MDAHTIVLVISMYEERLQKEHVPKQRIDPKRTFQTTSTEERLMHAHYLCGGAKQFALDPERQGKANRHLTAIQMCLSFAGWYTLEDLMNHNRLVSDT